MCRYRFPAACRRLTHRYLRSIALSCRFSTHLSNEVYILAFPLPLVPACDPPPSQASSAHAELRPPPSSSIPRNRNQVPFSFFVDFYYARLSSPNTVPPAGPVSPSSLMEACRPFPPTPALKIPSATSLAGRIRFSIAAGQSLFARSS